MRRLLLFLILAAGLAAVVFTAGAVGQDANSAIVVVTVPSDAVVYFDDTRMQRPGTTRTYSTPPLNPGTTYRYTIKAEVVRDGRTVTDTKQITVRAGETTRV